MKITLTAAGLLAAVVVTTCGGSSGHNDSYNKGFEFADTNGVLRSQAGLMGPSAICGAWATNHAQGLNQQERIQGYQDALERKRVDK